MLYSGIIKIGDPVEILEELNNFSVIFDGNLKLYTMIKTRDFSGEECYCFQSGQKQHLIFYYKNGRITKILLWIKSGGYDHKTDISYSILNVYKKSVIYARKLFEDYKNSCNKVDIFHKTVLKSLSLNEPFIEPNLVDIIFEYVL
jgi:hypothetical protein